MLITIVTLYRENIGNHFVGAIIGKASKEQKKELAERYDLDEEDEIFFTEVQAEKNPADLHELLGVEESQFVSGNGEIDLDKGKSPADLTE